MTQEIEPPQFATYELLLEGPRDSRTMTIRRLRTALMDELKVSMERAQGFIEEAPITIQASDRVVDLQSTLDKLSRSGARAQIIKQARRKLAESIQAPAPGNLPRKISFSPKLQAELQDPNGAVIDSPFDAQLEKKRSIPNEILEQKLRLSDLQSAPVEPTKALFRRPTGKPAHVTNGFLTGEKLKQPKTKWDIYRKEVAWIDSKFRSYLQREFAISQTLLTLVVLLACALLIQVGIYADNVQYRRYQRSVQLLERYISIAVLGSEEGYLDPALAKEQR